MGADVGSNRSGVRSDINVTPLIDVVLVLLIIFMVITPMLQRGKAVELPKATSAKPAQQGSGDPLFITVTPDGRFWVETEGVDIEGLTEKMRQANAIGRRILVKADRETEYAKVRPILDRASKAKLKGVQLAAEEIKRK